MKKSYIIIISTLVFTILITIHSELAFQSAFTAMKNTITKIIPSLFPYMIISTMIVSSGAADIIGRLFPIAKLFKLPYCASTPIIIGALCGFPLGAKTATELYEKGYLNKTETEALISIANNTGPSFIIFVIGATFWRDIFFGIFLYVAQLITAFIAGYIVNRFIYKSKPSTCKTHFITISQSFTESLSKAITSASLSSVYICGFITFFSTINSIIGELLKNSPEHFQLMICAILEFSEAASSSADNKSLFAYFVCGFSVGWSGLSVFCQTAGFTTSLGLSLKRCIITKLTQGILLGLCCIAYSYFSFNVIKIECFSYQDSSNTSFGMILYTVLIILCVISYIKKHKDA